MIWRIAIAGLIVAMAMKPLSACSSFTSAADDIDAAASDAASSDAAVDYESCKKLHEAEPLAADGMYNVRGRDGGAQVAVYCDMTTADGGWTLAARSVANADADASFGWTAPGGDVSDPVTPFAADLDALALDFSEILLGARGDGMAWSSPIYHSALPTAFVTACASIACNTNITAVKDGCTAPTILAHDGFTADPHRFFFRDLSVEDTGAGGAYYGLKTFGWGTAGLTNSCQDNASLDGKQGMIFVR